jgi:4-amino-4-deoxy-L-arabinose transferase-like glycosyltransferase
MTLVLPFRREMSDPMQTRTQLITVGVFALLVPAALALVLFPTPMIDTRELFAWGRFFPLVTHKHPPMMAWIGGLIELVVAPTAFAAVLVGQALNAVAVLYVYATLRLAVDRDRAMLFAFFLATSVYLVLAPLSFALNAEMLQLPAWAAIIHHFLQASRTNKLGHWLALAVWAAAAVLTKYTAGLLFFCLVAASLSVADYRRVWRNPRFYAAIVLGVLLIVPHLLALWRHSAAFGYAERLLVWNASFGARLLRLLDLVGGILLFLTPGLVGVAIGFYRGDFVITHAARDQAAEAVRRFLLALCIAFVAPITVAIFAVGFHYHRNYDAPLLMLIVLAAGPWMALRPEAQPAAEERMIQVTATILASIFVVAILSYGFFVSHDYMQEPAPQAAAIVRADWAKTYSCGPGYILGDRPSSHALALQGDRHPIGIPVEDIPLAPWYDPALLKREGAIVVYRGEIRRGEIQKILPNIIATKEKYFTLPLINTFHDESLTYHYFFIPPQSC